MGSAATIERPLQSRAEARSTLYALFAKALSHPSEDLAEAFVSGGFEREVRALAAEAGIDLGDALSIELSASDEVPSVYATLFEAGMPEVSLREAHYVQQGEKILFEDLFRFYDHFGLDTQSGGLREWPDHIAVELEFMHYLTWHEAGAGKSAKAFVQAQQDFLSRHLVNFSQGLAERMEQMKIPDPYLPIAGLLADFISKEIIGFGR